MKASGPYWPLKSKILNIGRSYAPGHLELHKSNSVVSYKAMNCPEGLHGANIHSGLTNIPKSRPSRWRDQHKPRTLAKISSLFLCLGQGKAALPGQYKGEEQQ